MAVRAPGRSAAIARAERWQHVAADHDVIGAIAERDVDGDRRRNVSAARSCACIQGCRRTVPMRTAQPACSAAMHSSTIFSCGTSRDQIVMSACGRRIALLISARRSPPDRRSAAAAGRRGASTRRMMHVDIGLEPDRDGLVADAARVSSLMKAPPPVASTPARRRAAGRSPAPRRRGNRARHGLRRCRGSTCRRPASISVSASRNGSRSRAASRRPMVDLPAPIMPTSTTERVPSAA